jgi:hypothetical protein
MTMTQPSPNMLFTAYLSPTVFGTGRTRVAAPDINV